MDEYVFRNKQKLIADAIRDLVSDLVMDTGEVYLGWHEDTIQRLAKTIVEVCNDG